jgi:hypothetical protein
MRERAEIVAVCLRDVYEPPSKLVWRVHQAIEHAKRMAGEQWWWEGPPPYAAVVDLAFLRKCEWETEELTATLSVLARLLEHEGYVACFVESVDGAEDSLMAPLADTILRVQRTPRIATMGEHLTIRVAKIDGATVAVRPYELRRTEKGLAIADSFVDYIETAQGLSMGQARVRVYEETAGQARLIRQMREMIGENFPGPQSEAPKVSPFRSRDAHTVFDAIVYSFGERSDAPEPERRRTVSMNRTELISVDEFWLDRLTRQGCLMDLAEAMRRFFGPDAKIENWLHRDGTYGFVDSVRDVPLAHDGSAVYAVPYYENFGMYLANVRLLADWWQDDASEGYRSGSVGQWLAELVGRRTRHPGESQVPDISLTWEEMITVGVAAASWQNDKEKRGESERILPFFFCPSARESLSCFFLEVLWDVALAPSGEPGMLKLRPRENGGPPAEVVAAVCRLLYWLGHGCAHVHSTSWAKVLEEPAKVQPKGRHREAAFYRHWYVSHREMCDPTVQAGVLFAPVDSAQPDLVPVRPPILNYSVAGAPGRCVGRSMRGEWYWAMLQGSLNPARGLDLLRTLAGLEMNDYLRQFGAGVPARKQAVGASEQELLDVYFQLPQPTEKPDGKLAVTRRAILDYWQWRLAWYDCCRRLLMALDERRIVDACRGPWSPDTEETIRECVTPILRDFAARVWPD